jgi:hypothetical protein
MPLLQQRGRLEAADPQAAGRVHHHTQRVPGRHRLERASASASSRGPAGPQQLQPRHSLQARPGRLGSCHSAVQEAWGGRQLARSIQGGHQQVGGAGGLQGLQRPADAPRLSPGAAQVQHGRLGHRGEGLVGGLYHEVCATGEGRGRGGRVQAEVGAVGLVHKQGQAVLVADVCEL